MKRATQPTFKSCLCSSKSIEGSSWRWGQLRLRWGGVTGQRLIWNDRSSLEPVSCFNDLIRYHRISPGGLPRMDTICWGTLCWGYSIYALRPLINIYHCRSLPWVGEGNRSGCGRLNKDAQEVILQGYIQGSSINAWLKMAVDWWISGTWGGTHGGSGLQGDPAPLDSSVTRLLGP